MADELWVFRGTTPVMWRIPVKLVKRPMVVKNKTWKSMVSYLEPAVALLGCQRRALNEFLESCKAVQYADGWRLKGTRQRGQVFEETMRGMKALRATSDEPEDHLVWGPRPPPIERMKPAQGERRKWLEEMLARGGGISLEQLTWQWREFCLHIAHTLINREEPVDCIFFKLHNCPLRSRWREEFFYRKVPCDPDSFLKKILCERHMREFDSGGGYCLRRIEIEETQAWRKLIQRTESTRLGLLGPKQYAENFTKSVERFYPVAWRLHQAWLSEMARSRIGSPVGGLGSRVYVMSKPLEGRVQREAARIVETILAKPTKQQRQLITRYKRKAAGKNGRLPRMSDIRRALAAMRKSADERARPAVVEPGNREG